MSNPLFNIFGNSLAQNIMSMLPGMKQNPLGALRSAGFNVPDGQSNPQQIIQYLMQSGQVSQQQLDYAQKMAQTLGIKL